MAAVDAIENCYRKEPEWLLSAMNGLPAHIKTTPKEAAFDFIFTVMISFVNLHPKVTLAISLSSTIYFYFNLVLKRSPEHLSS